MECYQNSKKWTPNFLGRFIKPLLLPVFVAFIFIALGVSPICGQNLYTDIIVDPILGPWVVKNTKSISSNEPSDRYVTIGWNNAILRADDPRLPSPCNCSDTVIYTFQETGTGYTYLAPFTPNSAQGEITIDVTAFDNTPHNYSGHWKIFAGFGGRNNLTGSCDTVCVSTLLSTDSLLVRTSNLKPPKNLKASDMEADGSRLDSIKITWSNGSDLPGTGNAGNPKYFFDPNILGYVIERKPVSGGSFQVVKKAAPAIDTTYTDKVVSGTEYVYRVSTVLFDINLDTTNSSNYFVTDTGSALGPHLTVSDGEYSDRIRLSWDPETSYNTYKSTRPVDAFRIDRRAVSASTNAPWYQVAIVNKNATAYTDLDPIPGFGYTYRLTALDGSGNTIVQSYDNGYKKPNGILKGRVISLSGSGVANVQVCARLKNAFLAAKNPAVGVSGGPYCVSTDAGGNYEIRNVYYHDSASFVVTPSLNNHDFDPDSLITILDNNLRIQSGLNFIDQTALTASGQVTYSSPLNCGVEGVTILVDDKDLGIRTQADGTWSYAFPDSDTYEFKPVFEHHAFDLDSIVVNLGSDVSNISFVDIQKDSIEVFIQGGCESSISGNQPIDFIVTSSKGSACFQQTFSTSGNGYKKVVLPAASYQIQIGNDQHLDPNAYSQLKDTVITLDLTVRDTALVNNTKQSVQPTAKFIYLAPFDVKIDFAAAGGIVLPNCTNPDNRKIVLLTKGALYNLDIEIVEQNTLCPVETGDITVYDYISDREQSPVTLSIQNGHAFYQIQAGEPSLDTLATNEAQKGLFLYVQAGSRPTQNAEFWGLIEGAYNLSPTFSSRSPELPDLIVHDPPGDASYTVIERGSVFSNFQWTQSEISGSGGVFSDQTFGTAIKTPFSEANLGIQWNFELNAGRENFDHTGYSNTLTFQNSYSTSDDAIFTGYEGDVYIGKSVNQQFSIAKVLKYDTLACDAGIQDDVSLDITGFATTFVYTEKHIQGILIPQLKYLQQVLRTSARDKSLTPTTADSLANIHEADSFNIDVLNWNSILATNARNRDTAAVKIENLSFSSGAIVERTQVRDGSWEGSYEYVEFVDINTSLAGRFEVKGGGWSDNKVGVAASFRHSYSEETGSSTSGNRTVTYHLEDDDFGDFFTVDVLRDTTYDMPAFRIKSGTSSCPHEPGTQHRDLADINITPPQVDNVPIGGQAVFTVSLTNISNSQEAREYHVRVISSTNQDGAVVKLNGEIINHRPASFFLNAFQPAQVQLTVERGPVAANYENIGIMMYPPCEYELWQNNGNLTSGDTAYITVNFETECSNVSISNPINNWLINQNNDDTLVVDLTGYDLNNPFLETLTLQYRQKGDPWYDGPSVPADSINTAFYRLFWDVTNEFDGEYFIRAKASCSSGRGDTYSEVLSGTIDRSSAAPFGIPSPSDGFLRFGQEISITFDKPINCTFPTQGADAPVFSLIRADDSSAIAFTTQCSGNKIILQPVDDLFADTSLIGVTLIAKVGNVQDLSGNVQLFPAVWSFEINVNPVFWDPETVETSALIGSTPTLTGTLKNASDLTKAFLLTSYPSWLTPGVLSGTILAGNEYNITFAVDPELEPGIYSGTVTAQVDDQLVDLSVTFKMLAIPPNWSVDPAAFNYSMTVIAQFSLDNGNTQLATDERDMIGAFVDGQPRGVGQIQYIPDLDAYAAFVTIYSNDEGGNSPETVKFRFWRALNGVEYGAVETTPFVNDATLGTILSPFILHPDGIVQSIPLKKGWNWISLNVLNSNMSRENVLESLLSPEVGNDITIKRKDGKVSDYNGTSGWNGNLQTLDNNQGYMIHLSDNPDTLRVVGSAITPSAFYVASGWNWIGYQPQSIKTANEALASLTPGTGDIVKSQSEFAEYYGTTGNWIGSLQFMQPGLGYKLKLGSNDSLKYQNRFGKDAYSVAHHLYESNMTVIATVSFEGLNWVDEQRFLVGAFIGDTCRGVGSLEYVEKLGEYRIYLSVHGNVADQGSSIEFRLYDTQEDEEFVSDAVEPFVVDRILGHVLDPFVLFKNLPVKDGYFLGQNVPNPFGSRTVIEYVIPNEEQVRLALFDQLGNQLEVLVDEIQPAGRHEVIYDSGNLTSGVYLYRLEAGEFQSSRKMMIVR